MAKVIADVEPKQILVLAQSPLQLMVGLTYARRSEFASADIDLIVCNCFRDADKYYAKTASLGSFRKTYFVDDYGLPPKPLLRVLYSNVVSSHSAKQRLKRACPELDMTRKYDRMAFSSGTLLAHDLRLLLLLPDGKSSLFDDGIGTYTGGICFGTSFFDDILNDADISFPRSYRIRLMAKRLICGLLGDKLKFNIDEVSLLGNPAIVGSLYVPGIQVDRLGVSEETTQDIERVFNTDGIEEYVKSSIIFFSLDDLSCEVHEIEKKVIEALGPYKDEVVVRLHPRRTKNIECFNGCRIDSGKGSWEAMLFSGLDLSNKTLVGFASTAQLFPQLLFGMSPKNILLNRLLDAVIEKSNSAATEGLFVKAYGTSKARLHIMQRLSEVDLIASTIEESRTKCPNAR